MSTIVLGLPSKGRLMTDAIAWFGERGVAVSLDGAERAYAASASGVPWLEVALLTAGEIPRALAAGRLHLGVTGEDLIRERLPGHAGEVRHAAAMGFGHADLIVAVPAAWVDVETMHDLDEVAHEIRARHGHGLRVATKYPNLTRGFFRRHGVADYRLVDSQGATEAAPLNLAAEAIADITSSGETLRANHLKPLADGLILASQAGLWASLTADRGEGRAETLARLEAMLGTG